MSNKDDKANRDEKYKQKIKDVNAETEKEHNQGGGKSKTQIKEEKWQESNDKEK